MAIDFDDERDALDADVPPSMNTTPLIDVLLVLLVMLIITIPIQLHSVRMDLPAGEAPPDAPVPEVVRLELGTDSQLQWNGEAVTDLEALQARLQRAASQPVQPEIHLHAQARTPYDSVAAVLSLAQRLGLLKIGVVGLEEFAEQTPAQTGPAQIAPAPVVSVQ